MKKTTTPAPSDWHVYEIVLRRKVEGKYETLNLPATEATLPRYLESGAIEDLLPPDGNNLATNLMRNAIKRMVDEAHARADADENKRIVKSREGQKKKADAPHWSDKWLAEAYASDSTLKADALRTDAMARALADASKGVEYARDVDAKTRAEIETKITEYRARKFLKKRRAK
jgi:hypothetical protein